MDIRTSIQDKLSVEFLKESVGSPSPDLLIVDLGFDVLNIYCDEDQLLELIDKLNFSIFQYHHSKAKSLNWTANKYRESDVENQLSKEIEEKILNIQQRFSQYYSSGEYDDDFPKINPPKVKSNQTMRIREMMQNHVPAKMLTREQMKTSMDFKKDS